MYREGGLVNANENVQTTLVPAGSASVVEFQLKVPGSYALVGHSIFRTERSALGLLEAEGPEAPEIHRNIK